MTDPKREMDWADIVARQVEDSLANEADWGREEQEACIATALRAARDAALEEAAKLAESVSSRHAHAGPKIKVARRAGPQIAALIRALKGKGGA
jgi:hypothetical protein